MELNINIQVRFKSTNRKQMKGIGQSRSRHTSIAKWSKVLPLIDRCLSPFSGVMAIVYPKLPVSSTIKHTNSRFCSNVAGNCDDK